mmetsp:Transcript_24811/g.41455  ORF Transcript_24811/g.41455 Transcript_24811/m.41455 type:complete len:1156 (+) Transcript_24811:410-3877(+)
MWKAINSNLCSASVKNGPDRRIFILRAAVTCSLIIAAAICGSVSYLELHDNEATLFETQYDSIVNQAFLGVVENINAMDADLLTLANTYSAGFRASAWPFVAAVGFSESVQTFGESTSLENIAFTPRVEVEDLAEFSQFMRGVFEIDPNVDTSQMFVPYGVYELNPVNLYPQFEYTGYSAFSPYNFYTPILQMTYSEYVGQEMLGYNMHSDGRFAAEFDRSLNCSNKIEGALVTGGCGTISDAVSLPYANLYNLNPDTEDWQSMLLQPIYPRNDRDSVAGFIVGAMSWLEILRRVVPDFVTGLDIVIATATQEFTYRIENGNPRYVGVGDLHSHSYSSYRQQFVIETIRVHAIGLGNEVSQDTGYTVTFYPRDDFANQYLSNTPLTVAILFVCIILCCSVCFFVYDSLISQEFVRKQAVLDTKRRFVRFISHEVRTPLNTMRLGLKLFEVELEKAVAGLANTASEEGSKMMLMDMFSEWTQLVSDITENSESAVQVLDDILSYDKVEMGTLKLELSMVNIHKLIFRDCSVMEIQAKQKNVQLVFIVEGQVVDPHQSRKRFSSNDSKKQMTLSTSQSAAPAGTLPVADVEMAGGGNQGEVPALLGSSAVASGMLLNLPENASVVMQSERRGREERHAVIGDSARLGQVLRNLVSNALKFTPMGGKVTVSVRWVSDGMPDAEVKVADSSYELLDHPRAGSIRISVTDSGAGLTDKQLAEIGCEGVQFNANQLQAGQGSGLGLFISKGIIEQHGGALTVTSDGLRKGATFSVELPLFEYTNYPSTSTNPSNAAGAGAITTTTGVEGGLPAIPTMMNQNDVGSSLEDAIDATAAGDVELGLPTGAHGAVASMQESQSIGTSLVALTGDSSDDKKGDATVSLTLKHSNHQQQQRQLMQQQQKQSTETYALCERYKKLLVVDDSPLNRKMLCRVLKAKGFTCCQAEDGQQAIDMYKSLVAEGEPVDGILMDFEMPVMNGPTATKHLRNMGCTKLICGVTGNVLPEDVHFFRQHGADAVLAKPLIFEDFETVLRNFQEKPLPSSASKIGFGINGSLSSSFCEQSAADPNGISIAAAIGNADEESSGVTRGEEKGSTVDEEGSIIALGPHVKYKAVSQSSTTLATVSSSSSSSSNDVSSAKTLSNKIPIAPLSSNDRKVHPAY